MVLLRLPRCKIMQGTHSAPWVDVAGAGVYTGRKELGGAPMPEIKNRYTVRSQTTDLPGRTLNHARTNHWIIDSPSGPNESTTTGESFMSGIAACGVSLVEMHAKQKKLPFGTLAVDIDAIRT